MSLMKDALTYWTLMQELRHSDLPLTRAFARENRLPTLAASTEYPRISQRIYNELGTQIEQENSQ